MAAHQPVNHHHAYAGYVAELHALQQGVRVGVLRAVHEHKVGGATDFNESAIQIAYACRVAGGKAKHQLSRNIRKA